MITKLMQFAHDKEWRKDFRDTFFAYPHLNLALSLLWGISFVKDGDGFWFFLSLFSLWCAGNGFMDRHRDRHRGHIVRYLAYRGKRGFHRHALP